MLIPIFIISLLILGAIIYINFEKLKPKWTKIGAIVGKLKWWHKGALVGLGLGVGTFCLTISGFVYFPLGGFILAVLNLFVLPFDFLVYKYKFFENIKGFSFELGLALFSVYYIIKWILAGIVLAGIFHTIRRLTKHSRRNKKQ